MEFSTKDRDHDKYKAGSCARTYKAGWWYKACYESNMNIVYGHHGHHTTKKLPGVQAFNWKGFVGQSIVQTTMMIRPYM